LEEGGVGCGGELGEAAIKLGGGDGGLDGPALGEVDLVDVAGGDVGFDAVYFGGVVGE
jgi:hypothetical protein